MPIRQEPNLKTPFARRPDEGLSLQRATLAIEQRRNVTRTYDRGMATTHITEAELARDLHAILEQIRQGGEVVVEQDHRPVAIMKPAEQPGRLLSESIAIARQREKERGAAVLDPDFAEDMEEIVRNRQLWNPTSWD